MLAGDRKVRSAFLVIAMLESEGDPIVALAIYRTGGSSEELVRGLGEVFRSLFASDQFIDFIFVSDEQEREASAVCKPFYVALAGDSGTGY